MIHLLRAHQARGLAGTAVVVCAAALVAVGQGARASDQRDHERARAAVQAGQVLPLPVLLQQLQQTHPGQVLELELEREHGRWLYEIKLLHSDGRLLKLGVDGATGKVLRSRGKEGDVRDRRGVD